MNIWIIMIAVMVLSFIVQQMLQSRFRKYSEIPTTNGMTGAEVAQKMLNDHGIYDVKVVPTQGMLTDHFNPQTKTVALSEGVYSSRSVAAAAVAAHECGHAIQDQEAYMPLKLRAALVPAANLGSRLGVPIIILGVILGSNYFLVQLGIWVFSIAVLFQLVTLPVEFNASNRAMRILESRGILGQEELGMSRKVLSAAALTYVAAALTSILQLLRLLAIAQRNDD